MWCPKISSSRSLCKGLVLYPAKNKEIYGIVPYQNFSCHVTLLSKENFNMCVTSGSCIYMWVISGLFCGSVGKWVNRCDPLSTLLHMLANNNNIIIIQSQNYSVTLGSVLMVYRMAQMFDSAKFWWMEYSMILMSKILTNVTFQLSKRSLIIIFITACACCLFTGLLPHATWLPWYFMINCRSYMAYHVYQENWILEITYCASQKITFAACVKRHIRGWLCSIVNFITLFSRNITTWSWKHLGNFVAPSWKTSYSWSVLTLAWAINITNRYA